LVSRDARRQKIGYNISRLIEQHGGSMRLPDLRMELAQGCGHAGGHDFDRCDVFFPQLAAVASS